MRNKIITIVIFGFNTITFLFQFLFWNKWKSAWNQYFDFFVPSITIYLVATLLALSSVFLVILDKKNILARILGLSGLFFIEFILYKMNFIFTDNCPCSRLFTFLSTEIHFWINTVVILIIAVNIFDIIRRPKTLNYS